ncbi:TPA: deoxyribose-phosphate aldolase [Legionella feeleii]
MSLEADFLLTLDELNEILRQEPIANSEVIPLIDLTLLDETAGYEELYSLGKKANLHQVAAVCVLPEQLEIIRHITTVKLATVANFPTGNQPHKEVLAAIEKTIINTKVDEIDYVFPYQDYLAKKNSSALTQCQQVYQLCQQENILFKVILETGALPSMDFIYALSTEIINNGCDFLKTSTGKIAQGATPSAAFAMLKAIKESKASCGLKVSGGLKQPEQAFTYMALASHVLARDLNKSWFRIGASSLLDVLLNQSSMPHTRHE